MHKWVACNDVEQWTAAPAGSYIPQLIPSPSTGQWLGAACSPEHSHQQPTPSSHLHRTTQGKGSVCQSPPASQPTAAEIRWPWFGTAAKEDVCTFLLLLPKLPIHYLCQHTVIEQPKPTLTLLTIQDKRTFHFDNDYFFPSIRASLVLLKIPMNYIFWDTFYSLIFKVSTNKRWLERGKHMKKKKSYKATQNITSLYSLP